MSRDIRDMLFILGVIIFTIGSLYSMYVTFSKHPPAKVVYDCRIAEISPDFPLEVKQRCRELQRGTK